MALRNFRKHWKKYVAGQLLGMVVTSFLIKRLRWALIRTVFLFPTKLW